ncbi:MAG: beta-phosphoglucomutase family hydrolase [Fimbriimonadaceae bacterium]
MPQTRALIFDMDGTLVDNMEYHAKAWIALFADNGVAVTEEEFYRTAGMKATETVRHFMGGEVPEDQCRMYAAQKEFLYRYLYRPKLRPVRGLRPLIRSARSHGLKLAVATASSRRNIEFTLGGLGLRDAFDAVAGAHEVERGKPHPDLFLLAARRMEVEPEQCLVFEDAGNGLEAAHRAGMRAIGVATFHSHADLASYPSTVRVVRHFGELRLREVLGG